MGVGESRVRKVLSGGWAGWSLGGFIEVLDSGNILLYSKGGRCFAAASDSYIAAAIAMLCSSQNVQGHVLLRSSLH